MGACMLLPLAEPRRQYLRHAYEDAFYTIQTRNMTRLECKAVSGRFSRFCALVLKYLR